ncbi:hypothetical protein BC937DRAFT_90106 [Endogone sp. FLAS-F59071]|nr:hypothetical protein BC937DRAFT_90106 [Endogone sp. FLAS-F59071]|eukprot:RUS17336.1 hypothetical protein BC937DRAFT_90106 [Endogone sp. FLAS-F59071]
MTTFEQPTNRATPSLAPSDDSPSLQLPMASFAYDDLRARMGAFAAQFDSFVGQGRQNLLEMRQKWLAGVAEDRERYGKLQQEFEFYTSQEAVLSRTMEKERQEATDARGAIDEFARQRQVMQERKDALQAQVDAMKAELRRKREAKQSARRALEAQRNKNEPELMFFEDKLAMQIVGIKGVMDR